MAKITIKLEGITNIHKLFKEKGKQIIDAGEKVINTHMIKELNSAKSKIHRISGETEASLKYKIDGKGSTYVVGHIGTIDGTKEECIRANSLEYGHAAPGDAGGTKVVGPHSFIRSAIKEDKSSFRSDMKTAIKAVIEE